MTDDKKAVIDLQERLQDAYLEFMTAVRKISEDEMRLTARGEKLMGVARALCDAELGKGRGDNIVLGGKYSPPMHDGRDTIAFLHPIRPLWWHFLRDAVAALTFFENADGAKSEVPLERVVDFMATIRDVARGR